MHPTCADNNPIQASSTHDCPFSLYGETFKVERRNGQSKVVITTATCTTHHLHRTPISPHLGDAHITFLRLWVGI